MTKQQKKKVYKTPSPIAGFIRFNTFKGSKFFNPLNKRRRRARKLKYNNY